METKIIKAVFGGGRYAVTTKRTRTDYGQVLEFVGVDLPDTFECIFSNSNTSAGVGKRMIGSAQRVLIPDEYLATGQTIYAWVLVHDSEDDGRHMYNVKIPVDDMPDLSPEEPTPVEQSVISQAIAALNTAVDTTSQKAQEASDSADRAEQAADGIEAYVERAEAAQNASESARDIALEAKVSAQASAATASEKASEAISSATTASQSALTAESASESAQEYATASAVSASASAVSASQASEHASTAGSKATEASGYANNANASAQTASQKASEAAQSAQTAVQAKTDAESAKTASQTAQTASETARDEAVTAKADAESARDEAQEIANGITGKVEQIDSNTTRIESLEDDRYKPYPTDSASGSIASFPDGADDIPLKSCIVQVEPVQEGSGDPSPDNVRPITGWTGVQIQHDGTNLFDGEMENGDINQYTGENNGTSSSRYRSKNYIPISVGTYYFNSPNRTGTVRVFFYDKDKNFLGFTAWNVNAVNKFNLAKYIRFRFSTGKVDGDEQISINSPSSVTDYVPYVGHTYPITFPSEAGTIYGAYVDVLNGELVVDRAIVDLGTLEWLYTSGATYPRFSAMAAGAKGYDGGVTAKGVCSVYPIVSQNEGYHGAKTKCIAIVGGSYVLAWDNAYTDAESFKTAMSGVQLVYELAEPIHYPITSHEVKSLLGQNNLWADTGDTEVEYRADTTLYISRLTEPDADMVADNNITEGSYFMVGNNLYRATVNIASGAQVIEGTNATKVSLATALNEINA